MFTFIRQKLLHKVWLNLCLLCGIVILAAVMACLPMYQNMAKNQTFQNAMKQYISEQNRYPSQITIAGGVSAKNGSALYDKMLEDVDKYGKMVSETVNLTADTDVLYYQIKGARVQALINVSAQTPNTVFSVAAMRGLDDHIQVVAGTYYKTTQEVKKGTAEDGVLSIDASTRYTCLVSGALLDKYGYYIGQTLEYPDIVCADGSPLRLTITGVFEEKDSTDPFFVKTPEEYTTGFFVSEDMMQEILADLDGKYSMQYQYTMQYDYKKMKLRSLNGVYTGLKKIQKNGLDGQKIEVTTDLYDLLESYQEKEKKIAATLWILELPILSLLLVFIYMISAQILELEGNEIATLKSRGVSVWQLLWIYFLQSLLLAVAGVLIGLPIGYGLCRLLGQSNAFLEFVNRKELPVSVTPMTLLYCLLAVLLSVAFMTLPLLVIARKDIVAKKAGRGIVQKGLIEKYYLDVGMLLISGYAYYSFHSQQDELAQKVLNGKGLDPFLFLSATLFLLGFGMVLLRVFRLLTRWVYKVGEKKWSPALYASFLQIMRTQGKQGFLSLFLIVALGMGVYYSNIARTINQNTEDRIRYDVGADLVVKEAWIHTSYSYEDKSGKKHMTEYLSEPSTNLRGQLDGKVEAATYVIRNDVTLSTGKLLTEQGQLMAIQTKEFGNTAWLRDGLMDRHWYYYLNDLAKDSSNVLVSSNARDEFGLKIGDEITASPRREKKESGGSVNQKQQYTQSTTKFKICGFVDVWPGFSGYRIIENEDGTKTQEPYYLVIANEGFVESSSGSQPGEIWMKTGEDKSAVYECLGQSDIVTEYVKDAGQNLVLAKQEPLLQITNGMLTLSFFVVMVLCVIGFLIYWITSIRQRELLFGIYRAMGMSMREIVKMLVNEQIFCSLAAAICGTISGIVTSKIFISLITIAFAPEKHALEYRLYSSPADMIRIALVVMCMLGCCVFVLARMLRRMKIAQALKLGED